jgi:hypothetical protein
VIEPIRLAFDVDAAPAHAFDVWTARIGQWWPADHTVTAADGLTVVLEPRPGGRIFERTPAGIEHDWGEVTVWQPPSRLSYLWHLGTGRAAATEVDIRFVATGQNATRVEIEHTGWERLGEAAGTWRDSNVAGWQGLLPHFKAAAEKSAIEEGDT